MAPELSGPILVIEALLLAHANTHCALKIMLVLPWILEVVNGFLRNIVLLTIPVPILFVKQL